MSKVTPLPTKASGFLRSAAALPLQNDDLRLAGRALRDAEQRAHPELPQILLAQHLDGDAELFQRFATARELHRIQHVGGLGHEIAGEEHAVGDALERPPVAARAGKRGREHGELAERRLFLGLELRVIAVEAVAPELRAQGDLRGHGFRCEFRARYRLGEHRERGFTARQQSLRERGADVTRLDGVEFRRRAGAGHEQAVVGKPRRHQNLHDLALLAFEARRFQRARNGAFELVVELLRVGKQAAVFAREERQRTGLGQGKGGEGDIHRSLSRRVPGLRLRGVVPWAMPGRRGSTGRAGGAVE